MQRYYSLCRRRSKNKMKIKSDKLIEELEGQGKLPKNPQKGGEEYENEQPRQGF